MAEYIEREALKAKFMKHYACEYPAALVLAIIDNVSTADVADVRHGKNITEMNPVDEFICSECGFDCVDYSEVLLDEDGDYMFNRECEFNYCPNCGARMGDDEE